MKGRQEDDDDNNDFDDEEAESVREKEVTNEGEAGR